MISTGMRRVAAVISGAILAGAVAATSAPAARVIPLAPGGYVYLAGTSVRCGFVKSTTTFISCGVVDSSGNAIHGSYVAAMTSTGRVAMIHAIRPGKTPTVFDRTPAAAGRTVAKPGDRIDLPGTLIACSASLVGGKPTIFCDYLDSKSDFRAGSYAFGISDTIVTSLSWDAKGHVHLLHSWPENG